MARRIFGINTRRQNITVPAVGAAGCKRSEPADCCDGGSGSGSGSGCFTECDQCVGGMSEAWTVTASGYETAILYRDTAGENPCAFDSVDLSWRLYFDHETEVWFLVNNDDESLWYLLGGDWVCAGPNELINDLEGGPVATLTATDAECGVTTYNCSPATVLFTTPGTYEWTVPDDVVEITVEAWGPSGAGGGTGELIGFGGAGGGAYSRSVWTVSPSEVLNVIVGSGGVAADWPFSSSSGASTVTSGVLVLSAAGSDLGATLAGGGGSAGGQASAGIGDVKYSGGDGGDPTDTAGGGGGGSAGPGGDGNPGGNAVGSTPGAGAAAVAEGGAGGDGSTTTGSPGTAPGGGGGGGVGPSTGGDGADGMVRITLTGVSECVAVSGTGGTYATLVECETACGTV